MSQRVGRGCVMADSGVSLQLSALYPRLHPRMSPSPELYMDAQPLDFSTKKEKASPIVSSSDHGDHSDSDRCSLTEEGPGAAINLVLDSKLWSRSSESGVSVSSTSPERAMTPPYNYPEPMVLNPTQPPHYTFPHHFTHPPTPPTINPGLLAQLHSNPILYSTLQSAFSHSKMVTNRFGSFPSPVSHSPSGVDFPLMAPSTAYLSSNPGDPLTSDSPRMARLAGSGLGPGGLGLGAGGLVSTGVQNTPNFSLHGLSSFDGLSSGMDNSMDDMDTDLTSVGGSMTSRLSGTQEEVAINSESNDAYARFRTQMLSQVTASKARRTTAPLNPSQNSNVDAKTMDRDTPGYGDSKNEENTDMCGSTSDGGGSVDTREATDGDGDTQTSGTLSNCAKRRGRQNGETLKDEAYWERRRKNNEAAKRSRDARRAKEDEIAIRAAFLEQENLKLRVEVASLKSETAKLRCMLYNS